MGSPFKLNGADASPGPTLFALLHPLHATPVCPFTPEPHHHPCRKGNVIRIRCLWLSDCWPHGEAAQRFGVLRTDGTAERALFIIDKTGFIRFIQVSDINRRPNLKDIADALAAIQ
jgi:hypothetical protein